MKRSLLIWPLAASLFTTGVNYVVQNHSMPSLAVRAASFWARSDLFGRVAQNRHASPAIASTSREIQRENAGNSGFERPTAQDWSDLAEISEWVDTSLAVRSPEIAGLPIEGVDAPVLNTHTDLFGFGDQPIENTGLERGDAADEHSPESDPVAFDTGVFFVEKLTRSGLGVPGRNRVGSQPLSDAQLETPAHDGPVEVPPAVAADLAREVDVRHFDSNRTALSLIESSPSENQLSVPTPNRESLEESRIRSTDVLPEVDSQSRQHPTIQSDVPGQVRSGTWPVSRQLMDQMEILEGLIRSPEFATGAIPTYPTETDAETVTVDSVLDWVQRVREALDALTRARRLGDEQIGTSLNELERLSTDALSVAETIQSRSVRVGWLQTAFGIRRRLSVWGPIYSIHSGEIAVTAHVGETLTVSQAIESLEHRLRATGDQQGWAEFLGLASMREAFSQGDDLDRREAAQKYLSRLDWPNLQPRHRVWLSEAAVEDVAGAVRPWATGAIDYSALLHQIEKAESNAIDLVTAEVAQSMQALAHAEHPQAKQLASHLDTYYRNANVRISVSEELLSGLMPKLPPRRVPVRTMLLGSRVTGTSNVTSELNLRLHPSPSSWELALETVGQVSTRSTGRRGPAAVRTSSSNPYTASTRISITPSDVQIGEADVTVQGRSRLRGIQTNYDAWPLVGTLVQSIAETEYFEKASVADRIGKGKMRRQLGAEIDTTLNEKAGLASDRFSESILGPLTRLQLDPQVVDMASTESRIMARYRMAGSVQLAAMTPRPRALKDNLFSLQVHQSAINNTLEQLVPQDEALPIEDALRRCLDVLGLPEVALPEDLPEDTLIHFAKHRPITIEIESGRVWITMRIIRLESGRHLRLRNFIVRGCYRPEVDGLKATLVRDGHLSVSGPRMSMRQRLPVRAVFNKVLSPSREIPLTLPHLLEGRVPDDAAVTQLELRDGWVGLSVGAKTNGQKVAGRPSGIR